MAKRRAFKEPVLQRVYDHLRDNPPADAASIKGRGGMGNAYFVGFTHPTLSRYSRGSWAYAAWAAGVDNARDAKK